jgi:hypothetical protein
MNTSRLAFLFSVAVLAAASAAAQGPIGDWRNLSTGGPLRPGVYGRIEVRGTVPPPVIFAQPVLAHRSIDPVRGRPVYLYVPPGQVRRWKENCVRWSACDQPVLFVRVDDSPSRWGNWRQWRDDLALHAMGNR